MKITWIPSEENKYLLLIEKCSNQNYLCRQYQRRDGN